MGELTGGLIEMNAKMVMTDGVHALLGIGVAIALIFLVFAVVSAIVTCEPKVVLVAMPFIVAGIVMAVIAVRQPRVREIHACASGPVSIEQIAIKYEIVNVDGKELVLRER